MTHIFKKICNSFAHLILKVNNILLLVVVVFPLKYINDFFFSMGKPRPLLSLFRSFQTNIITILIQQIFVKNVHSIVILYFTIFIWDWVRFFFSLSLFLPWYILTTFPKNYFLHRSVVPSTPTLLRLQVQIRFFQFIFELWCEKDEIEQKEASPILQHLRPVLRETASSHFGFSWKERKIFSLPGHSNTFSWNSLTLHG